MLLYTLVYGAMPFDGSDFHKLRKQISTGDYFRQPSKHSGKSLSSALISIYNSLLQILKVESMRLSYFVK